jgi:hypothetical protein
MWGDIIERQRVGEAALQVFADMLEPGILRTGKQPAQFPDDRLEKRQAIAPGSVFAKVPVYPTEKLEHASLGIPQAKR